MSLIISEIVLFIAFVICLCIIAIVYHYDKKMGGDDE